jgi:excisionase family DNA binding protein
MTLVLRELARELDTLSGIIRKISGVHEPEKELLTSDEVAARIRVHPQTVDKLVRQGLPCYRVGKGPKFSWAEVQQFLFLHHRDGGSLEQWSGAHKDGRAA